jgi:hypothetical protein
MQQALDALNNSVDLVREDAYNAEKLYGNYPTRQGKVGGLKVLADDHEKAITVLRDRLAQPELTIDGKTVAEFGLTELFELQEATGCDTAKQFREKQATQQEPVAWRTFDGDNGYNYIDYENNKDYCYWLEELHSKHKGWGEPLYTIPPVAQQRPWVGLTDEDYESLSQYAFVEVIEKIEAVLKEKNT